MRTNLKFLAAGATLGLSLLLVAGCGTDVNGPGFLSEDCLDENPPPSCEPVDPPVESVVPADFGRVSVTGAVSDPS